MNKCKVLVTGAAGLIGSHLCDRLISEGFQVIGMDNLEFGSLENLELCLDNPKFTFIESDIRTLDPNSLKVDLVCHLAAYKKAPKNSINSSDVMIGNFKMMESVLALCKSSNARLLFTSTSDVYGNSNTFNEDEPLLIGPPNVERYSYSMSKLHDEQLVLNLVNEESLNANIVRIFGAFSERSNMGWSGGHLPLFTSKALNNEEITIHGDGLQTRSMVYVSDIIDGLMLLIDKFDQFNGEIFNLGTDQEMTVKEAAERILDLTGSNSKIIYIPRHEAFGDYREIERRFANTEKANKLLGFNVKVRTEDAMEMVIKHWMNKFNS